MKYLKSLVIAVNQIEYEYATLEEEVAAKKELLINKFEGKVSCPETTLEFYDMLDRINHQIKQRWGITYDAIIGRIYGNSMIFQ